MTSIDMDQMVKLPCYVLISIEFGRTVMLAETLQAEIQGLKERKIRFTRGQRIALDDMEAAIDAFIQEINEQTAAVLADIESRKEAGQ